MTESTKKVILRLKEARVLKKMSYQDIVDTCEQNKEPVSLGTVKRLFAKGSEDAPGDYRSYTLNAIFHAVIGTEEVEFSPAETAAMTDTEKEIVTENSALRAMVDLRDATITELHSRIAELAKERTELEHQLSELRLQNATIRDMFQLAMESLGRGTSGAQ